jgi:tetratricopeptide (TPR) repeat protein
VADDPNKTPSRAPDESRSAAASAGAGPSARNSLPEIPPSPALQWFLLVAFLISGAAYIVNEWTVLTTSKTKERSSARLRLLVQSQSEYLAHSKAGSEAFARKHYDQAVSEFRLALQGQNNASIHDFLGQALLKQGNPDAAFAQFREALRLDPSLVTASSAWGLALMAEGKPEEASNVFHEALQSNPNAGLLHYNLATTLLQMQTEAEGRRRMAVAAGQTQDAEAAAAEAKSQADEALRHFTKASRNGIDSPAFWCGYGQLLNQLGQYSEAESSLLRVMSKDPNMASAHFQLALAEDHLGKYAEAIEHYGKVLTLTPDDSATLNNLALLYATATNAEVRTPKMAEQLATRACDATAGQNARYMDTLARCYAAAGDFFEAITWEDKAIHRAAQLKDGDLARELEARYTLYLDHKSD